MSAEILNHPRFKGRIPAGEGQGGQPRQPAINPRQANRASDYLKIEEELKRRGDDKLSVDDRLIIARNLGRILAHFKDERGLISGWLVEAGVSTKKGGSTKHLHRVAVYDPERKSGKGLMPKLTHYRRMAELAAHKSQPRGSEGDIKGILVDLVEGSSLDPDKKNQLATLAPHEREIAESFSDLLLYLDSIAQRVILECDLDTYFRKIVRWHASIVGGEISEIDWTHPLYIMEEAATDPDYWSEQRDFFPLARLFEMRTPEDASFPEAHWRDETIGVTPVTATYDYGVWFGIAPLGPDCALVPVIGRMPSVLLSCMDSSWQNTTDYSVLMMESFSPSETPIDIALPAFKECDYIRKVCGKLYATEEDMGHNETQEQVSMSRYRAEFKQLTLASLYEFVHHIPAGASNLVGMDVGHWFRGMPTLAVAGTMGNNIERFILECDEKEPYSLLSQLRLAAQERVDALNKWEAKRLSDIKANRDDFLARQKITTSTKKED